MDPLTVVGLLSNVVQLVEVSWKIVSKSHDIYRHGSVPEHRDIETVTADLQKINDKLLAFLSSTVGEEDANEDDEALRLLCESSNKIAVELIQRLAIIKPDDEHRSWKSIRQALKSVWLKSELDDMAVRLQAFRTQLNTRILVSVRDRIDGLDQGNKNILHSIAESRVQSSTSQEIQTDYLTRFITSQHDRTRELLANLTVTNTLRPVSPRPVSPGPVGGGDLSPLPAAIELHKTAFDATEAGNIPEVRRILRYDPSIILAYNSSGQTLLHVAARRGDAEMVAYLLRNSARVNPDDDNGRIPVHEAVAAGSEPVVRALVANRADVLAKDSMGMRARDLCDPSSLLHWIMVHGAQLEVKDETGATALHHFASQGDVDAVRTLLKQGADFETVVERNRQTPLFVASERGFVEIVEMLLSHGANTECTDTRRSTPLITAGKYGQMRVGKLLLDHGANIEASNQHNFTALAECCDHGRVEMAHMLLKRGAKFDRFDEWGSTPLHQAAVHCPVEVVEDILDRGADVNVLNSRYHWTALTEACNEGRLPIVEFLLSRGARTEEWSDELRKTALMRAAERGYTDVVRVMLETGKASLEAADKDGKTALYHAVDAHHLETTRYLISKGANVEVQDKGGYTLLGRSAQASQAELVRVLVEEGGANINNPQQNAWTPLHEACFHGAESTASFLISHGAKVDARDNHYCTPLHRASQSGGLGCALLLLDQGKVDIDLVTQSNWTALSIACWYDYADIVKALLQRGAKTDIRNSKGETALALAKIAGHQPIVSIMEEHEKGGDG